MNRSPKNNHPLWTETTVVATLPTSPAAQTLVRGAVEPYLFGGGFGSIGSVGRQGKTIIGLEWSSSTSNDIFLGRVGATPLGEGFKVDGERSFYMPCNGIPSWLTYQCVGLVDVVVYFE